MEDTTETVPSSVSNLLTLHRHRNLHGTQLENLMRLLGSSPKTKVLRPSPGNNGGTIAFPQKRV